MHVVSHQQLWQCFVQEISPQTNPELVRLIGQLRTVSHALYQIGETNLEPVGLSYAQYRVLMALLFSERMEQQPSLNPSEISRLHSVNRNTVSALIRRLEELELIERELDTADRRKFNIRLTEAGRRVVQQHTHRLFDALQAALADLTAEEIAAFGQILAKLNVALNP